MINLAGLGVDLLLLGRRWVRFAKSRVEVNRRQPVSTGVNLCSTGSICADAPECARMCHGGFVLRNRFFRVHLGAPGGFWVHGAALRLAPSSRYAGERVGERGERRVESNVGRSREALAPL